MSDDRTNEEGRDELAARYRKLSDAMLRALEEHAEHRQERCIVLLTSGDASDRVIRGGVYGYGYSSEERLVDDFLRHLAGMPGIAGVVASPVPRDGPVMPLL